MHFFLDLIERRFAELDRRSRKLLDLLDDHTLYKRPTETVNAMVPFSCGEFIVRSAAKVEQTFGGITTRLWDDPFEWTLPEKLSTVEGVREYLDEVTAIRQRGLAFFASDADLQREIPSPEKQRSLGEILLETIATSEHYLGRASAIYQTISSNAPPRL
ncbi:MAG: hypothetical protein IPO41_02605 [Acidobacteria bacterium]|nr:hypothetical protein [Acidobacteriota bacterium]MBK9527220.1 hypothetical protein [Acidobacteriota bacterium]MBP7475274.1 hypothetical protein [Pyrinomonadaceae bacterium]MBP9108207.1 hypothetical protein [Pyrinomonadaceae bacterium]